MNELLRTRTPQAEFDKCSIARVGRPAPDFTIDSVSLVFGRRKTSLADYRGRWLILIFYPRDFSFVCPTELTALSNRIREFEERQCDLLGVSVDTTRSHVEWLNTPQKEGGLQGLRYPLASDPDAVMSTRYGVYDPQEGVTLRALFIIDPHGIVQYQVVHNLTTGRHTDEILRVVDALQTGGLCAESWSAGEETIDPAALLLPGRVVGNYRIEEQLGAGGFATVFKAKDLRLERPVALKMLRESSHDRLSELLAEARPAARLAHPNICTVYGVEEHDTLPMIVMEYLPGRTLAARLAEGPLHEGERHSIAQQIANGLAAAHSIEVAHGDVKPANAMILPDGTVKLLDFGLAKRKSIEDLIVPDAAPASDIEATMPVFTDNQLGISGTPAYLSPERTWGDAPSAASDVFAFGALIYELATGRKAFAADSVPEIVQKVRCVNSQSLAAGLAEPYHTIVRDCLRLEAPSRPTMAAIADWLG